MMLKIQLSKGNFPFIRTGFKKLWIRELLEKLDADGVDISEGIDFPLQNCRMIPSLNDNDLFGKLVVENGVTTSIITDIPGIGGEVNYNVVKGASFIISSYTYSFNAGGVKKYSFIVSHVGTIKVKAEKTGKFTNKNKTYTLYGPNY